MSIRDTSLAEHPAPSGVGSAGRKQGHKAEFHRRFMADDLETRHALEALVAVLGQEGIDETVVSNAELILAEVLNNVVEHAYAEGTGPVELTVGILPGGLSCEVADQGKPLPSGMVPPPDLPEASPDSLPEGGFGWHIIRCLTSDLSYTRESGENRLTLQIPWTD